MTEQWPPKGHDFTYQVVEDPDNARGVSFDLALPGRDEWNLASVRVRRHGGPTEADLAFREKLYRAIGAIAVAGGHVETAMKRVLLVRTGSSADFSTVDGAPRSQHRVRA